MSKYDKLVYKIGFIALMVAGFCWGWVGASLDD